MNLDIFKYILTNNETSEVKVLENAPGDWQDTTQRLFRSVRYNSVLREDTLSFRFVLNGGAFDYGGYYFLLDAYEANGIYADITCERQRLNSFTNEYEDRFVGKVDFNPDSGWSFQEEWAEFKLIDSGKLAKFIARDEIDVDVFKTTSIDGIEITGFTNPYQEITAPKVDIPLTVESDNGLFSGSGEATPSGDKYFLTQNIVINEPSDRVDLESGVEKIYTNSTSSEARLDFTALSLRSVHEVTYTPDQSPPNSTSYLHFFVLSAFDESDTFLDNYIVQIVSDSISNISSPVTRNYDITIDESDFASLNVPVNGYLTASFISSEGISGTITPTYSFTNSSIVFDFIEFTLGWPDNQVRGFFANEMANRFIQLYTSETDTAKLLNAPILGRTDSEFQSYPEVGYFGFEFIFNGYHARQFIDRALNVNFNDFFRALNTDNPIGFWFDKNNDIFEIKPAEDYYKLEAFPIHLGEVTNFKRYPAKDYYSGQFLTGYPKSENEDFQGVNEFSTETEHSTKTESKTKKDLRSRWRRSTIDIELLRRKNISKYASEDTKHDENNYIVSTDGTTINQGELSNASGIINIEQYYNQLKTPRQNLKRQLVLFGITLYKVVDKFIQFGKSAKDTNISYIDPTSGLQVNEFDDIDNDEFPEPLLVPETLEFTGLYTNEIENELAIDPHRYFQFTAKGKEWYGYIDPEIIGKPYTQQATYKLIRLNENRL